MVVRVSACTNPPFTSVRGGDCSDLGEMDIMAWMTVGGDEADVGGFGVMGHEWG